MKVLMVNGSPHAKGNTYIALHEAEEEFRRNGIDVQMLNIGMTRHQGGCIACRKMRGDGKCVL